MEQSVLPCEIGDIPVERFDSRVCSPTRSLRLLVHGVQNVILHAEGPSSWSNMEVRVNKKASYTRRK